MKTSVRNQFAGLIVSLVQGPVSDEIDLLINGSHTLKAAITHESCRELHLDIGSKVFALIKASGVMISRDRTSITKNNFEGIIQTLIQGEKKSEITMHCGEGLELVSTLPNDELNRLALRKGERAFAYFDAANVIIGIAA